MPTQDILIVVFLVMFAVFIVLFYCAAQLILDQLDEVRRALKRLVRKHGGDEDR